MTTSPHPGASPTGPILHLSDGTFAQPYEHWEDYDDVAPGQPAAHLRLSDNTGTTWSEHVIVAADPTNRRFFWDQRLAVHPDSGELVAMFWTHDSSAGQDLDVHIAWGSTDGHTWTSPAETRLPGQHCQPIPVGGDHLVAVYTHRRDPPGIHAAISNDFGHTWDRSHDTVIYRSTVGTEAGITGPRNIGEYWADMVAWRFGHPRGVLLPSGEVFVVYYAGDDWAQSVRWARLAL